MTIKIVTGIDYAKANGDQPTVIFVQFDDGVAEVIGRLTGPAAIYVASLKADIDALLPLAHAVRRLRDMSDLPWLHGYVTEEGHLVFDVFDNLPKHLRQATR